MTPVNLKYQGNTLPTGDILTVINFCKVILVLVSVSVKVTSVTLMHQGNTLSTGDTLTVMNF